MAKVDLAGKMWILSSLKRFLLSSKWCKAKEDNQTLYCSILLLLFLHLDSKSICKLDRIHIFPATSTCGHGTEFWEVGLMGRRTEKDCRLGFSLYCGFSGGLRTGPDCDHTTSCTLHVVLLKV